MFNEVDEMYEDALQVQYGEKKRLKLTTEEFSYMDLGKNKFQQV